MNLKFSKSLFCHTFNSCSRKKAVSNNRRMTVLKKVNFSSKDENDNLTRENQLKKMLRDSSPLKSSAEVNASWASSSYAKNTVFREEDVQKELNPAPAETSIIMFPGQGNQFVGMANRIIKYPVVKDMFSAASSILGYDLLKLCTDGPEENLNKTVFCQPALLVCELGALEILKDESPNAINNCSGVCGYSLGELAALVFAGCISFEKAITLVKIRAEAMEACCKVTPGGMLTVLYGPGSDLNKALTDANNHCKNIGIKNSHCAIAIYLFPGCKVVAGHMEALNFLLKNGSQYNLRKLSKLPVSGAFHTNIMKEASDIFKEAIQNVDFKDPLIKVYSNVNGKPYKNRADIKAKLPKQIYLPVKWEQTMHSIFERPKGRDFPYAYECGPGSSLRVVLKKINLRASENCYSLKL